MTTDAQTHTFRVGDIQPNPFRHIDRYPIREDKVAALRESLGKTGFWGNVVARIREDGKPEIAYGHHRLEALRREYGPDKRVPLIVRDLDDDAMLKIMARENMEEWGTSAAVEQETVRAVVEAYAEGKIELPLPPPNIPLAQRRFAPSFIAGERPPAERAPAPAGDRPYTAQAIAEFLGWMKRDKETGEPTDEPQSKVYASLNALELIERGVLSENDFDGLGSKAAEAVVTEARKAARRRETAASVHEQDAEAATEQAETAETDEERERAVRRAEAAQKKAGRFRQEATRAAQQVGRKVSREIKSGAGYRDAPRLAREVEVERNGDKGKTVYASEVCRRLSTEINNLLRPGKHRVADKVEELIRLRESLTEDQREEVVANLEGLVERAGRYAQQMRTNVRGLVNA